MTSLSQSYLSVYVYIQISKGTSEYLYLKLLLYILLNSTNDWLILIGLSFESAWWCKISVIVCILLCWEQHIWAFGNFFHDHIEDTLLIHRLKEGKYMSCLLSLVAHFLLFLFYLFIFEMEPHHVAQMSNSLV